jgi:protein-disulfide isomerase
MKCVSAIRLVMLPVLGVLVAATVRCARSTQADHLSASVKATNVLATVGQTKIAAADVDGRLAAKLIRIRLEEYKIRRQELDQMIADELLKNEAARRGVSVKDLLEQEVDKKVKPVTDEEAAAVYETASERLRMVPPGDALRSIADSMSRQRLNQRRQAFSKELERAIGVHVTLEPPRLVVDPSDDPSRGPERAPITIVEFSDFQCPYCAQVARTLNQIEGQYKAKVRLVFRDFPLPMHKDAAKAAEAASCAAAQDRFWEMHDILFQNQKNLSTNDLRRYADTLKLNPTTFAACLDSGRYTAEWQQDQTEGRHYGVTGTPALFINGRPVFGAVTLQELTQTLDQELERLDRLMAAKGS